MPDPEMLERVAARCAELDGLEQQLAKQLDEVRAERNAPLAAVGRVLERVSQRLANEGVLAAPALGQVGGRAVILIPHREPRAVETMLPLGYQRVLAAVRQAAGPVCQADRRDAGS